MALVNLDIDDNIAIMQMDDGKANAFSHEMINTINQTLDELESNPEVKSIVLVGRPGRLSGGFDLSVMSQGGTAVQALVGAGAKMATRLYGYPKPVVVAASGHALAMGAILLFTADYRIGVEGDFKIGLNEVAIGMTMPMFGIDLGADRLSNAFINRAVINAEIFTPELAVEAGFLDDVTSGEDLIAHAKLKASELANLDPRAFAQTKLRIRQQTIDKILTQLDADLAGDAL